MEPWPRGRKIKRYVLLFVANMVPIIAFFCVGEWYLRQKGFLPYVRTYPEQYQDEPGVEWAKQNHSLGWTIEPQFLPGEINAQGFRDTKDFTQLSASPDKMRMMVLGALLSLGHTQM